MKHLKYLVILLPAVLCAAALLLRHKEQLTEPLMIPAASEEERIAYLRSEGWEGELLSSRTVIVPKEEDAVFAEYAELQSDQQLSLNSYAGKQAELFVYSLRNTELCAELLIADGILIGSQCYDPAVHNTLDMRGNPLQP